MAGIVARPFGIAEWVWTLAGSVILVVAQLVGLDEAFRAVAGGTDVYLFLTGMMLLSEISRRAGVFDWMAARAAAAARGSAFRLFVLVYAVGVAVTIVLSNDATAIVLTPAVATIVRNARFRAHPYVFACAFVSNAASFVLPISNPANLIVFAGNIPALGSWLRVFALPSAGAIVVTFFALAWLARADLRGTVAQPASTTKLGNAGRAALYGIALSAAVLLATSAVRGPIGAATFASAAAVFVAVWYFDRRGTPAALRAVSWSILVLVASLFILVAALRDAGGIDAVRGALAALTHAPGWIATGTVAAAGAFGSNLANNLPIGVIAGQALSHAPFPDSFRYAAAIGVDLGPNLSVTGSLATILWLVALRREGIAMNAVRFLRAGIVVMPPALIAAVALLLLTTH